MHWLSSMIATRHSRTCTHAPSHTHTYTHTHTHTHTLTHTHSCNTFTVYTPYHRSFLLWQHLLKPVYVLHSSSTVSLTNTQTNVHAHFIFLTVTQGLATSLSSSLSPSSPPCSLSVFCSLTLWSLPKLMFSPFCATFVDIQEVCALPSSLCLFL